MVICRAFIFLRLILICMKTFRIIITALLLVSSSSLAFAQMKMAKDTTKKAKHKPMDMNMDGMDMDDMDMGHDMTMNSQYSLNVPMSRDGSGTSWVPDETPMYAYMIPGKKWMTMIHGSIFMRYNNQDLFKSGSRGGEKVDAPDWFMAMT